jgi:hypothetical protein
LFIARAQGLTVSLFSTSVTPGNVAGVDAGIFLEFAFDIVAQFKVGLHMDTSGVVSASLRCDVEMKA